MNSEEYDAMMDYIIDLFYPKNTLVETDDVSLVNLVYLVDTENKT
jgi:hypothetical protein